MTDDFQLCHRALGTEDRRTSDSSVYHGNKGFLPVRLPEKRRGFVRVAEYTTEGEKKKVEVMQLGPSMQEAILILLSFM